MLPRDKDTDKTFKYAQFVAKIIILQFEQSLFSKSTPLKYQNIEP